MKSLTLRTHVALVATALLAGCAAGSDGGSPGGSDGGTTGDVATTHTDGGTVDTGTHDAGHDVVSLTADAGHDAKTAVDAGTHDTGVVDTGTPTGMDSTVSIPDTGISNDVSLIGPDGGIITVPIVYGQSADTLYSLDPSTDEVTAVGPFIGCDDSGVIDIALDKDSNMYATTFMGVYTVDTTSAVCTLLQSGTTYPNSLSFVPAGTVDPTKEALVGYQGASYVRIDTTTGDITTIGSLGGGFTSSGDIVSVIGGGTYLTVTSGSCTADDCLVEVNPTTGALIHNYGSVNHTQVYGLAFWAGTVYGFDSGGDLFSVAFPDAGPLVVTTIPIPDAPLGLSFYGAGSTTAAPKR